MIYTMPFSVTNTRIHWILAKGSTNCIIQILYQMKIKMLEIQFSNIPTFWDIPCLCSKL